MKPETTTSNDQQQQHSSCTETNHAKYKGVRKRKWGKWVSEIRLPNSRERIWLGSYDKPEKAARAFDAALFCLRGPNANFNFPSSPPDIVGAQSFSPHEIQEVASKFANEYYSDKNGDEVSNLDASSSSANYGCDNSIDWSFLDVLDTSDQGGSSWDFSNFLEFDHNMAIHELYQPPSLPPPPPPVVDDNGYDVYPSVINIAGETSTPTDQQSFLWNFDNSQL